MDVIKKLKNPVWNKIEGYCFSKFDKFKKQPK